MRKGILQRITDSEAWRSIFRTGIPDTDLKRSMLMFNNFFLHIFPVKMKPHGLRFCYTFCLGGISFLLFIILTITGLLLMFYYHPSVPRAYEDMKDIQFVVSSGVFLRNMHRWSARL